MPMKNAELQREYQRQWRAKRRADWFADKVCVRCGTTERLRLDHIDAKQKISHNIWSWSRARRDAELAKCQVLCHDCHWTKTVESRDNARGSQIGSSVLDDKLVRKIRREIASGATRRGLGRKYGVDEGTIRYALKGWRHVT